MHKQNFTSLQKGILSEKLLKEGFKDYALEFQQEVKPSRLIDVSRYKLRDDKKKNRKFDA